MASSTASSSNTANLDSETDDTEVEYMSDINESINDIEVHATMKSKSNSNAGAQIAKPKKIRKSKQILEYQQIIKSLTEQHQQLKNMCREQHKQIAELMSQRSDTQSKSVAAVSTQNQFDILQASQSEKVEMNTSTHSPAAIGRISVTNIRSNETEPKMSNRLTSTINNQAAFKRAAATSPLPSTAKRPKSDTALLDTSTKTHKPPPIVITNLNCKALSAMLNQQIGADAYSFRRVSKHATHVLTNTLANFKIVRALLLSTDANHHTFTPKEEQHINIVLRHLDMSYDENDVTVALADLQLDISVVKVMNLPTKSNNKLWLIQLKAGSDAKQLLDQRLLLHQRVVFERKKQNGVAQCKNCQLFGHSARNCNHQYRCVKCTEQHMPGQCPRTINKQIAEQTPPSCVNCNAEHPANFKGCPYYIKTIERMQKQMHTSQIQTRQPTSFTSASAARTEGVTYASATAPEASKTHPTPPNMFEFFDEECKKHFDMEFSQLHAKMKEFLPSYTALPDNKRPLALMSLALSLVK